MRILEKEYFVACAPEERTELLDSAELLNGRMKEIRDSGKIVGLDRIAVMAALNLAHEVLKLRARDHGHRAGDGPSPQGHARTRRSRRCEKGQQLEL